MPAAPLATGGAGGAGPFLPLAERRSAERRGAERRGAERRAERLGGEAEGAQHFALVRPPKGVDPIRL